MKKPTIEQAREIVEREFYDWADDPDNTCSWEEYRRVADSPDSDFEIIEKIENGKTEYLVDHPALNEPIAV